MVWSRRYFAVWIAVCAGAVPLASCFDGADSLGLPCERDEDCGTKHSCDDGFCGGRQGTGSTGSMTDPTDTSSGSGESGSDSTGIPPTCGDAVLDDGEECDEGGNTAGCDEDCTLPACDDGVENPMAEECDDGNDSDFDDCTTNCRRVLFHDDANSAASFDKWMLPSDFAGVQWNIENDEWVSGDYQNTGGEVVLRSVPITIPEQAPADTVYALRFRHEFSFDKQAPSCQDLDTTNDGGVIQVQGDSGIQFLEAEQPNRYPGQIGTPSCLAGEDPNPYEGEEGFVEDGVGEEVVVHLDAYLGQTIQLRFAVGYDCGPCNENMNAPDNAWKIDDVVVSAIPF